MADIHLRFHKSMLVLSSPAEAELTRLGVNVARDGELTLLIEPELFDDIYKLEGFAGAQCVVAFTAGLTPARLARADMQGRVEDLAAAALKAARTAQPQHVLVEIGPCGLPLDAASKASLNENCDQYKRAAKLFEPFADSFDAFFLNGFERVADLKCALIGLRKVTDVPVFASVNVDAQGALYGGVLGEMVEDAAAVMAEYGAQVAGFQTAGVPEAAAVLAERVRATTHLPILVQLEVRERAPEQENPTPENPYFEADTMVDAADVLRAAGVQFLRATGDATPAYTGALVAATDKLDSLAPAGADGTLGEGSVLDGADLESVAERLRVKVNAALN